MQSRLAMNTHALMKTKNQRGAIFVLFAVTIPFLIAFSSLTVDMAYIYAEKEQLQNAADAAALAGANTLTTDISNSSNYTKITSQTITLYVNKNNSAQVENTASNYTNETIANPTPDKEIEATYPDDSNKINVLAKYATVSDGKTIAVELRRRVPLHFMQYFLRPLGITTMPVAVTATAKRETEETVLKNSPIFQNALATSSDKSDSIYFPDYKDTITGNIYTNGQITVTGNGNSINGHLTTASPANVPFNGGSTLNGYEDNFKNNAAKLNIDLTSTNTSMKDLIDLINSRLPDQYKNAFLLDKSISTKYTNSSATSSIYMDTTNSTYRTYYSQNKPTDTNSATYTKTDTAIQQKSSTLIVDTNFLVKYKIVISNGDIITDNINNHELGDTDIMLISLNGSIKIEETEPNHNFKGVAYAPNGKIEVRAPSRGSLVAHDIYIHPHDGSQESAFTYKNYYSDIQTRFPSYYDGYTYNNNGERIYYYRTWTNTYYYNSVTGKYYYYNSLYGWIYNDNDGKGWYSPGYYHGIPITFNQFTTYKTTTSGGVSLIK